MKISLRIFLGYFLIVGLAAWFVLDVFMDEVKPGVRQSMEDSLVDTANVLAELAVNDIKHGSIEHGNFATSVERYRLRHPRADVWGMHKNYSDYRIYITDLSGKVIFDSQRQVVGQDFSRWNDVYLTLKGQYGVRSSLVDRNDKNSGSVMHVAAPIKDGNNLIGVLTVAKPNRTVQPFIDRAQTKIMYWGILLVILSLAVGAIFTWRLTRAIHRLRDYANVVAAGGKADKPTSSNDELAELAAAMANMREQLDGKQYIEDTIHHLAHELKSPLAGIHGAAEIIDEGMSEENRSHFMLHIRQQADRLRLIVDNMLELASLEHRQHLQHVQVLDITELVQALLATPPMAESRPPIQFRQPPLHAITVNGDRFLLSQAISNLLENALDFTSPEGLITVSVDSDQRSAIISVTDTGNGIPDYAIDKVFDKFYSLPRPAFPSGHRIAAGRKSTGLGLSLVREIVALHGGTIHLENRHIETTTYPNNGPAGGVIATIKLPLSQGN